jgi:hypothetical protein
MSVRRIICLVLLLLPPCAWSDVPAQPRLLASAAELQATYRRLARELGDNSFQRPLHIDSSEAPGALAGDIHAVLDYPIAALAAAFGRAANWCDMLILHVNTKYCRASGANIAVQMGAKTPEPFDAAALMTFAFGTVTDTPDYFEAELAADRGPLVTRNYRIRLAAIPLPGGKSFLHLSYAYDSGMAGRLAMQAYLLTGGRGKVGFTSVGTADDGRPAYIGGVRAVVERNTMRYYLAVDAYLAALSAPAADRFEQRIANWYSATEQFARQLHEVERDAYLGMKRDEYRRQQAIR